MRTELVASGVLTGLCLVAGFSWAAPPKVVATVGEVSISVDDLRPAVDRAGAKTVEGLTSILERRIELELLHAAALREGIDRRPEVMEAIKQLIVDRYLLENLSSEVSAVTASEAEIESFYRAHRDRYEIPPAIRGAVIRVSVSPRASDAKRAELLERVLRAHEEAASLQSSQMSFGSVAVTYSDDQASRYRGGEIGWLQDDSTSTFESEVLAGLRSLERPGEVSEVIETGSGYYLVKLMERRPGRLRSLEEVRARVAHEVRHERSESIRRELFEHLEEIFPVSFSTEELASMLPAAEPGEQRPPAMPER